jgi:membrane-bound serine protease (ClpP class)
LLHQGRIFAPQERELTVEELLINPNIAYLVLVAAFLMAGLAIVTPGTGVLEIGTVFLLMIAGWELYNLPINGWALVIILVGFGLYFLAVRKNGERIYLALALLALAAGSWFLFSPGSLLTPSLNPLLFILVTAVTSAILWFLTIKLVESSKAQPRHDLEALIGTTGEARTPVFDDGSVQVAGELWSARSNEPIPAESPVRVVGRDGFILLVEAVSKKKD